MAGNASIMLLYHSVCPHSGDEVSSVPLFNALLLPLEIALIPFTARGSIQLNFNRLFNRYLKVLWDTLW